jgi:hypothetical protein
MAGISQIVQYRPLHHTAASSAFHPMTREISSLPLQGSTAFDIDPHNGFLPSQEPLSRLNGEYEAEWEQMLDRAMHLPLLFAGGSSKYTSNERRRDAILWRKDIRAVSWCLKKRTTQFKHEFRKVKRRVLTVRTAPS